jgi:hypothetical protein
MIFAISTNRPLRSFAIRISRCRGSRPRPPLDRIKTGVGEREVAVRAQGSRGEA